MTYVAFTRAQQRLVPHDDRYRLPVLRRRRPRCRPHARSGSSAQAVVAYTAPSRARERARKGPIAGFGIARRAIRDPDADREHILAACRSLATAQRVLAAAVRSAGAPSGEHLTVGQAAELLHDLAAARDEELSITIADPDVRIANLAGSEPRATAEAFKPPASS